ncbi:MAG TPA: hypothetical protein VG734_06585 [Lacunisphaera sp.]|nr:hypothetical protein [Lacunisphaera sp.]
MQWLVRNTKVAFGMQVAPHMTQTSTELGKEDYAAIIGHLDACIAILDKNTGRRPVSQVRLQAMLTVLRGELLKSDLNDLTLPPFSVSPPEQR